MERRYRVRHRSIGIRGNRESPPNRSSHGRGTRDGDQHDRRRCLRTCTYHDPNRISGAVQIRFSTTGKRFQFPARKSVIIIVGRVISTGPEDARGFGENWVFDYSLENGWWEKMGRKKKNKRKKKPTWRLIYRLSLRAHCPPLTKTYLTGILYAEPRQRRADVQPYCRTCIGGIILYYRRPLPMTTAHNIMYNNRLTVIYIYIHVWKRCYVFILLYNTTPNDLKWS